MPEAFQRPRRRGAAAALAVCGALALGLAGCGGGADPGSGSASAQGAGTSATRASVTTLSPERVAGRVRSAAVLLVDVREDVEWRAGHARGAIHVPLGQVGARLGQIRSVARGRPVAFICHSGNRSAQAAQVAVDGGLTRVLNVSGGTAAWQDAGLPMAVGR